MWEFLQGWKTRIFAASLLVLGLVDALDPSILSTALGLGDRGHAVVLVLAAVGTFILRQMTTTPPTPLIPKKK